MQAFKLAKTDLRVVYERLYTAPRRVSVARMPLEVGAGEFELSPSEKIQEQLLANSAADLQPIIHHRLARRAGPNSTPAKDAADPLVHAGRQ